MQESPDRVEEFKADVAAMKLRDPASQVDRVLFRVGVGGMAGGIAVTVFAYFFSHGTTNQLQQRDAIIIAIIGLAVAVCGAACFVRASLGSFLRFWLARVCYEQAAQGDRIVDALSGSPPSTSRTGGA
jgi:hypothetical protein